MGQAPTSQARPQDADPLRPSFGSEGSQLRGAYCL